MKGVKKENKSVVLFLIDGLGIAQESEGNAISKAGMPFLKELIRHYPATVLSLPTEAKQKTIDQRLCYSSLGGASSKNHHSFLDTLTANKKRWCLISEPEKIALSSFFLNGRKKASPENCFFSKENPEPLKNFNEVCNELLKKIKSNQYDFLGVFTADLEIISRKGDLNYLLLVIKEIDRLIAKLAKNILEKDGCLIITAANGQAENFFNLKTEQINKSLPDNPVPIIFIDKHFEGKTMNFSEAIDGDLSGCPPAGTLSNIAPTIIRLLNLPVDKKLPGKSLI